MNQAVLNVIAEMETVFEKAGGDFAFENIYNEMISDDNYADEEVPYERAEADWNEITGIMNRFYQTCRESGEMDDFSFVFAVYCNFYIRKGFYLRMGVEAFEQKGDWFAQDQEYSECLRCLWKGIRDQKYIWFERALERKRVPVAAMYLFVRQAAEFSQAITCLLYTSDAADE